MQDIAPPGTNVLILADVAGLHESPLGKSMNWAARHAEDYQSGVTPFPDTASAVMFAREVDPRNLRTIKHEVGVIRMTGPVGFKTLVDAVGGKASTIGKRMAMQSPHGVAAAMLDEKTLVTQFPADRTWFGKWLEGVDRKTLAGPDSPYLKKAAAAWPTGAQVVIATDMSGGIKEEAILEELRYRQEDPAKAAALDKLAAVFATLEGMRLAVRVTDVIAAEWSIDFSRPIGPMEASIRPYFEEAVKRMGSAGADFSTWKMSFRPNAVVFNATLKPEEFGEMLGSIHSPILAGAAYGRSSASTAPEPDRVQISHRYFRSVRNLLGALDKLADSTDNYVLAAMQYDRIAARIQRMSTYGVDPDIVTYSNQVVNLLYGLSSSLRGVPREAAVPDPQGATGAYNTSGIVNGWNYPWRWGWVGPVYLDQNTRSVEYAKTARTIADEAGARREIWLQIRQMNVGMEKKLTDKYGVDFTKKDVK